ncbi:MAG: kinase [Rhodospirillales bacterium]|nr:kinase [Rhodospirillales bacterium]
MRVAAPARLHLGFLDLHGGLGRKFGSLGVTLEEPRTVLTVRGADKLEVSGASGERARRIAMRLMDGMGLTGGFEIAIDEAIPEHAGLGSGTQLALALGAALARCAGQAADPRRIALLARRGARSGIGIGAFALGGVILDGGRAEEDDTPPPIVSRLDFPEPWRVLLIVDPKNGGLHGPAEYEAFRLLPQFPERLAADLSRLMLMQALPALAEADLPRFGEAVSELQRRVGDYFSPVQGGRFSSPHVAAALSWLEAAGIAGFGQSSWGPTGFAFAASPAEGEALMAEAERRWGGSLRFRLVKGRNRGAEIESLPSSS